MLQRVARILPASWLRFIGQLQYKAPVLAPVIQAAARRIVRTEGVIQRGVGKGLRFRTNVPVAGYILGTTEPELQQVFADFLTEGDVVYDLGANVGFYTLLSAHLVGLSGHVYAFEPFEESLEIARSNLKQNGFDNVTFVNKAVADVSGSERLQMGLSPATFMLSDRGNGDGIQVSVTSLDAFLEMEEARPPSFIKIDVEGAEKRVIRGMKQLLRMHRPTLLCEVHYAVSNFEQFVQDELAPIAYRARSITNDRLPVSGERFHVIIEPTQ